MNKCTAQSQLEEYKIQASILLKSLRSNDPEKSLVAAKKFQCLSEFLTLSIDDIKKQVKRKHALNVIAIRNHFNSWVDLKSQIYFIVGGFLNKWFAHYEEAKAHQKEEGEFVFPYKKQFFICDADYLRYIGFDPEDPDWKLMGNDWVKPIDQDAWHRIHAKWLKNRDEYHG